MKEKSDHREVLYTIDKRGKRKWVYAHYLRGFFLARRTIIAWILIGFYLLLPWISIGGKQGVLLDIPHRRFIFFGLELWATDTIFLFLTLASLGLSLFFFTALLGRVWCGWACPETVFLEFVFRPIERLIEGSDSERRRLDSAPWTLNKITKKLAKHSCCAVLAWIIASTALAYFLGREPLLNMMTHSPLENLQPFILTIVGMGLMAFQFGWFREQFCTLLCPYARFQSVLMDQNSLLVGYDPVRGEPRGKLSRENQEKGDCIDCGMCVRVCPTGIDIRNGTQLECIACANCIDACDSIMNRIGKEPGLIRYSTEAKLLRQGEKLLRPRIFVYALALIVLISSFVFVLKTRKLIDAEFIRVANSTPYSVDERRIVSNQYSLHISNKSDKPEKFKITCPDDKTVELVSPISQIEIKAGESNMVPVFVRLPEVQFKWGSRRITVQIEDSRGSIVRRELNLIGPEHL